MKTLGYLISTLGTFFLAFVAIANAKEAWQIWLLVAGVAFNIVGYWLRWEQYKKLNRNDFWEKEF